MAILEGGEKGVTGGGDLRRQEKGRLLGPVATQRKKELKGHSSSPNLGKGQSRSGEKPLANGKS